MANRHNTTHELQHLTVLCRVAYLHAALMEFAGMEEALVIGLAAIVAKIVQCGEPK